MVSILSCILHSDCKIWVELITYCKTYITFVTNRKLVLEIIIEIGFWETKSGPISLFEFFGYQPMMPKSSHCPVLHGTVALDLKVCQFVVACWMFLVFPHFQQTPLWTLTCSWPCSIRWVDLDHNAHLRLGSKLMLQYVSLHSFLIT